MSTGCIQVIPSFCDDSHIEPHQAMWEVLRDSKLEKLCFLSKNAYIKVGVKSSNPFVCKKWAYVLPHFRKRWIGCNHLVGDTALLGSFLCDLLFTGNERR